MTTTINADNGVVSGSAGLKSSADSSGVLALQTNGTTAVTVGTDQSILMTGAPSIGGAGYGMGMGFRNRIINGAMVIDQRNAGASVTPTNGAYSVDRWAAALTAASKFSVQQNAGSVAIQSGFSKYLGATSLSSYSVSSGDLFSLIQYIEGNNVADLGWGAAGASSVTLSFWVRSSLTGTFGGSVSNSAANRCYVFSYTISASNTWEYKTVTIAGDTSGTWLTDTGIGIRLGFSLGAGATYTGAAGSWGSTYYTNPTGGQSVVGTNAATWYVTGVQLEKGSTATAFDYRDYGREMIMCQRYYYKIVPGSPDSEFGAMCGNQNTTVADGIFMFPVTMRTPPTALEQTGTAANYAVYPLNGGARINCSSVPVFGAAFVNCAKTRFTVASGLTAGQVGLFLTGSAAPSTTYLGWSAEL